MAHNFEIRVITEDGELVSSDNDFLEAAVYDWFDTVLRSSVSGEVVQLIDTTSDAVLIERRVE